MLFPTHTLSNFEILEYANMIGLPIDCIAKNQVPKSIPKNTGLIVNLQDIGQSGSHWVCAIRKNNKCLYYDSFGITYIPKQLENCLIKSVGRENIYLSNGQNQYITTVLCGYYTLYMCKSILLDGMSFKQATDQFSDNPSMKNIDTADNLFI